MADSSSSAASATSPRMCRACAQTEGQTLRADSRTSPRKGLPDSSSTRSHHSGAVSDRCIELPGRYDRSEKLRIVAPDQSDLPQLSCAVGSEELASGLISKNRMDSSARTKGRNPFWNGTSFVLN